MESGRRERAIRWLVCIGPLAGMAFCSPLWTSQRSFPTVPVLDILPPLPSPLCAICVGLFAALLIMAASRPSKRFAPWLAIACGVVLVAFDVNRLQPWFFQSLLLLAALGNRPATGFVLVATYAWSGIHKLNESFADRVFPWLAEPLGPASLNHLWFAAPFAEITIAVLLAVPRTRVGGVVGAAALHMTLLWILGPFGHDTNSVVWPWNTAMPILVAAVFLDAPASLFSGLWKDWPGRGVILAAGLLPALNLLRRWDDNLAFALYSGKTEQAFLFFPDEPTWLSGEDRRYLEAKQGRWVIDVTRWCLITTNAPPYPETWAYRSLVKRLAGSQRVRLIVARPGEKPLVVETND